MTHENIISLHGVVVEERPELHGSEPSLMLVLELAEVRDELAHAGDYREVAMIA